MEIKCFQDLADAAIKLQSHMADKGMYIPPRECIFWVLKRYRDVLEEEGEDVEAFDENFTPRFVENFLNTQPVDLMIN